MPLLFLANIFAKSFDALLLRKYLNYSKYYLKPRSPEWLRCNLHCGNRCKQPLIWRNLNVSWSFRNSQVVTVRVTRLGGVVGGCLLWVFFFRKLQKLPKFRSTLYQRSCYAIIWTKTDRGYFTNASGHSGQRSLTRLHSLDDKCFWKVHQRNHFYVQNGSLWLAAATWP
jgi:hypothetical protein